jgi:hypothetical protein
MMVDTAPSPNNRTVVYRGRAERERLLMSFRIGQKVVCIRDGGHPPHVLFSWQFAPNDLSGPALGEIVTIDDIYDEVGICWLGFVEWDHNFDALDFRPLTDISVFKKMLIVRKMDMADG